MKNKSSFFLIFILNLLYFTNEVCANEFDKSATNLIHVEISEVHELTNIIIAITDYGLSDSWEVQKRSTYYKKVISHFLNFKNHSLIRDVNYSREKWAELISFRSDAYSFEFNENDKIIRRNSFRSFDNLNEFEKKILLIEDFSRISGFRNFFADNANYLSELKTNYSDIIPLNDMVNFLKNKVNNVVYNHVICISPLLGRQNLHRNINENTTIDFVPVPDFILNNISNPADLEIATDLHSIFTEISHAYVNPITFDFGRLIKNKFIDKVWDLNSGYSGYKTAVFNEYLTWSLYDLFILEQFPKINNSISLFWHFQNADRGFIFSYNFSIKLIELYSNLKGKPHESYGIKEVIPRILDWSNQQSLKLTYIINHKDTLKASNGIFSDTLIFSEPMKKVSKITMLIESSNNIIDTLTIEGNSIFWIDSKHLKLTFSNKIEKFGHIIFNWWGTQFPLVSEENVLMKPYTRISLLN